MSASLSEQPFDVLQLLGATLSQLLAPMHLTALACTCSTLGRALAGAVQELKRDHRMLRAMLTRCGTTLGFVAGGPRVGLMWGGKSIDAAESRLIAMLVQSGALSHVPWLSLNNNNIGDGGLSSISVAFRAGRLAQLKELSLSRNQLSDLALAGLAGAVASGALDTLLTLRLSCNQIGDAGLSAFARALQPTADLPTGALPRLRELSLHHNQIGEAGVAALARACEGGAAPLAQLSELHLFNNALGSAGLEALARACRGGAWPQLSHLDLREIDAGDGGLVALAAAGPRGALAQLKHLDLRHNPIGNPGTGALADALSSHLAPAVAFASLARLHLQLPWRFRDRMGSTRNLRPSPSPSRAAFTLHMEPAPRSTRPPTTAARFQQYVR